MVSVDEPPTRAGTVVVSEVIVEAGMFSSDDSVDAHGGDADDVWAEISLHIIAISYVSTG